MTNKDGAAVDTRVLKIVCVVRCASADALRAAIEIAERLNHPDSEITRIFVTMPGGGEEKRDFRIGDYFDRIELMYSGSSDASFSLTFHIRGGVDSSWKAVLVAALQAIRESAPGVKVSIIPGGAKT